MKEYPKINLKDLTIGKIARFNAKYYDKKMKKKVLEVLEYNKEDIKEYIFPEIKRFKVEEELPVDEYVKEFNEKSKFKIIDYNLGSPINFKADIPNDIEIEIAIPFKFIGNSGVPYIIVEVPNSKLQIAKYKQLKTMMKTNKIKPEEEILEINDEKIVYKLSAKPFKTNIFWKTIMIYTRHLK